MVQVSDQDMNTHLAEISRVRATEHVKSKGRAHVPTAGPGMEVQILWREERSGGWLNGRGTVGRQAALTVTES